MWRYEVAPWNCSDIRPATVWRDHYRKTVVPLGSHQQTAVGIYRGQSTCGLSIQTFSNTKQHSGAHSRQAKMSCFEPMTLCMQEYTD